MCPGIHSEQEIEEQLRKEDKVLVVIGKSTVKTLYALSISKWRFIRFLIRKCGSDGESLHEIQDSFIRKPCAFCYNYFEIDDSEDEACDLCRISMISPEICDDDGRVGIISKFAKAQSQDDFLGICNEMLKALRSGLKASLRRRHVPKYVPGKRVLTMRCKFCGSKLRVRKYCGEGCEGCRCETLYKCCNRKCGAEFYKTMADDWGFPGWREHTPDEIKEA